MMDYQDVMYQVAQNKERIQYIQDETLKAILNEQNNLLYLTLESAKDTPGRLDGIEKNLDKVLNYYDDRKQQELKEQGAKEFIGAWMRRIKSIGGLILLISSVLSLGWALLSFLVLTVDKS